MPVLEGTRVSVFLAVARRVVPETAALDDAGREEFLAPVETLLASKRDAVRRQLLLFLSLVRWLPAARYGRPFEMLDPARQDAVLGWLLRAPLGALRKGFWGLKTLVYLGWYGRPGIGPSLGYRPERDGNARLHA